MAMQTPALTAKQRTTLVQVLKDDDLSAYPKADPEILRRRRDSALRVLWSTREPWTGSDASWCLSYAGRLHEKGHPEGEAILGALLATLRPPEK